MKVILLKDIKGVGQKLDVKEVKDGYARNFLLAKELAEAAMENALQKLEHQKKIRAAERQKMIEKLKIEAGKIEGIILKFKMKTGEKGEIFGSVSRKDIEIELSRKGYKNLKVELEKPIKTIGEHTVPIDLGEGIKIKLKVITEAE
ncbi:MAG: 50S ribosomal protein L9 [Patescibacteria group bacterium]